MLQGKSALVFGGGRGVGRATVRELARRGADVAFVYRRDVAAADALVQEIRNGGRRCAAIAGDVADAAAVAQAFETARASVGPPTLVVNSAGAAAPTLAVHDLTPAAWGDYLAVDLNGAFNVFHHAVRHLRPLGGGSIVAVSSIASQMVPPRNSCGAAAKAGVEALVRVTAREEGRHGIRANAVAIGITDTDIVKPIFEKWGAEATARVLAAIPLQRIGQPEEVAAMICFLLGEEAAYITGKVMQVDGGQFIGG